MERYENIVKLEEIRRLVDKNQYAKAIKILDTMDISRLKVLTDLSVIADVYSQNERYEDAMEVLTKIYAKTKTRRVLYQLVDLSIKRGNVEDAENYLQKYVQAAPQDSYRFIFRYCIDKLGGEPYDVLIESLEKLKEYEYIEVWAYELAKLYHKAGMKDKCVRECSDIILWFGDGIYVEKARLLKAYYVGDLDPVHILKAKEKKEAEKKLGLDKTKDYSSIRSQINQFLAKDEEGSTDANEDEDWDEEGQTYEDAQTYEDDQVDEENQIYEDDHNQKETRNKINPKFAMDFGYDKEKYKEILNRVTDPSFWGGSLYDTNEEKTEEAYLRGEEADDDDMEDTDNMEEPGYMEEPHHRIGPGNMEESYNTEEQMSEEAYSGEEELYYSIEQDSEETFAGEETAYYNAKGENEAAFTSEAAVYYNSEEDKDPEFLGEEAVYYSSEEDGQTGFTGVDEVYCSSEEVGEEEITGEDAAYFGSQQEYEEETEETCLNEDGAYYDGEQDAEDEGELSASGNDNREEIDTVNLDLYKQVKIQSKFEDIFAQVGMDFKQIFDYFLYMDSCKKQIERCLENITNDYTKTNYMIITGEAKSGKSTLAKKVVKALYGLERINTNQIAKIKASRLNTMSIASRKDKLAGSTLIVEEAGLLSPDKAAELLELVKTLGQNFFLILEDTDVPMNRLINTVKQSDDIYLNIIQLPEYSKLDLTGFALCYLKNHDYQFIKEVKEAFIQEINYILDTTEEENRLASVMDFAVQTKKAADTRNKKMLTEIISSRDLSSEDFMYIQVEDFYGRT